MRAVHTGVPWFREKKLPTQVTRRYLPVTMGNDVRIARAIEADK